MWISERIQKKVSMTNSRWCVKKKGTRGKKTMGGTPEMTKKIEEKRTMGNDDWGHVILSGLKKIFFLKKNFFFWKKFLKGKHLGETNIEGEGDEGVAKKQLGNTSVLWETRHSSFSAPSFTLLSHLWSDVSQKWEGATWKLSITKM